MNARKRKKQAAKASAAPARWIPSEKGPNQVSCSKCGFTVETARAVETGWSATEHIALKYNFCPSCGSPMAIRPRTDGTA